MMPRGGWVGLVGVFLLGSACDESKPKTVRLPREVVSVLSGFGLPIGTLNTEFANIQPANPSTHIRFMLEFEKAPGMKMLRISPAAASRIDTLLAPLTNDKLPPLETDLAICENKIVDDREIIIEPNRNGRFELPKLVDGPLSPALLHIVQMLQSTPIPGAPRITSGNLRLELARVSGSVSALSILPAPAGTSSDLDIAVTLSNPQLGIVLQGEPLRISMDSLTLTCAARIFPPRPSAPGFLNPCGEIELRCVSQSLSYSGIAIDHPAYGAFPFLAAIEWAASDILHDKLATGIVLHFENFVGTGLGLVTDPAAGLVLKLTGTGVGDTTNPTVAALAAFCSPMAEPEPPTPPTRGLVRVLSTLGAGELIGEFGDIIPFDLIPEVQVEWERIDNTLAPFLQLQPIQPPQVGIYRSFGSELQSRADDVRGFKIGAELIRRVPSNCFRKPLDLTDTLAPAFPTGAWMGRPGSTCLPGECDCTICVPGAAFFLEVTHSDGSTTLTRNPSNLGTTYLGYPSELRAADFAAEVAPRLERIDGALCPGPNCPRSCGTGGCQPWTRIRLPFAPGPGAPWAIALWAGPSLQSRLHDVVPGIQPACGKIQKFQRIVGERILTVPSVTFGPMMVDSAEFPSERIAGLFDFNGQPYATGVAEDTTGAAFVRRHVVLDNTFVAKIDFTTSCTPHPLGMPHLPSPCWSERVGLPEKGSVFVANGGHSGTRVPRVALSTVFDPTFTTAAVADLGARRTAVHGTLDRSGLRVFTRVPPIYNSIGLTTTLSDYRGRLFLDWEHNAAFPKPGGIQGDHLQAGIDEQRPGLRTRWGGFRSPKYFANWRTDQFRFLKIEDVPASFCVRPEDKFAVPGALTFTGARLPNQITVPPSQYLVTIPGVEMPTGAFPGPFP